MKVDKFLTLVERLTGTPPKGIGNADKDHLQTILADDNRRVRCSQFNELLLSVNKNRVQPPFFNFFFSQNCRVGTIADGVGRFQQAAMRLFGNFIFAYRKLSRIRDERDFLKDLREVGTDQREVLARFKNRRPKLVDIERIGRRKTPFVGYLLAPRIVADRERCRLIASALESLSGRRSWKHLIDKVKSLSKQAEHESLIGIIETVRIEAKMRLSEFRRFLQVSSRLIGQNEKTLGEAQEKATRNQDIYLTWDHMDIYFATSMRSAWEFEDLYDFITRLMSRQELRELKLRYFDPTQSYTPNSVDKGLVEALMLKRADCTIYSVQDVDTLGKDSELAATLAQGKPVIAYAADVDVRKRAIELSRQDPSMLLERLRFISYADESAKEELARQHKKFVEFLEKWEKVRVWKSISGPSLLPHLCPDCVRILVDLCRIVARAEKRIYDKRAETLRKPHPLAVQVNLNNGVANGVLVVRRIADCARLLRSILTNTMRFSLEEERDMWYLREQISGCVYRVVTKNRKITNSFWNFYLT